jgi:predicted dienelactone hydrolase
MTQDSSKQQFNEKTTPAVISLAEAVSYQEDSVVSRTLVDCKTGTVTLFAFPVAPYSSGTGSSVAVLLAEHDL